MENNNLRPHYFWKLISAFIIGTIIFVLIFTTSYMISYSKLSSVLESQEQLKKDSLLFNLEKDVSGLNCTNFSSYRFTHEMDRIGSLIAVLEERLGKTNVKVLEQKETYSLLESRHLSYINDYNAYCKGNISTVLFFYSNKESFKDKSNQLGYILTTLKNKDPRIMIYSFDSELNASVISTLKQKYNISEPCQMVINEKTQNSSLMDLDEIETRLSS